MLLGGRKQEETFLRDILSQLSFLDVSAFFSKRMMGGWGGGGVGRGETLPSLIVFLRGRPDPLPYRWLIEI